MGLAYINKIQKKKCQMNPILKCIYAKVVAAGVVVTVVMVCSTVWSYFFGEVSQLDLVQGSNCPIVHLPKQDNLQTNHKYANTGSKHTVAYSIVLNHNIAVCMRLCRSASMHLTDHKSIRSVIDHRFACKTDNNIDLSHHRYYNIMHWHLLY